MSLWFFGPLHADILWTPALSLTGVYDDNIQFNRTNPEDDFIYEIEPELRFDYNQERTQINADGKVIFRRYQDNDDLNNEVYDFEIKGKSNLTERFLLKMEYLVKHQLDF